jgi:hypothetical protein
MIYKPMHIFYYMLWFIVVLVKIIPTILKIEIGYGRGFLLKHIIYTYSLVRNIKRKSVESCLHWFEPDDIGIISGLVHVEFQKFVSVL